MQYVCVLCSHVLGKILKTKYRWETNWSCSTHYICACPDCMNTKKKLYYTSVFLVKKNETNWSCSTHYICACPECMKIQNKIKNLVLEKKKDKKLGTWKNMLMDKLILFNALSKCSFFFFPVQIAWIQNKIKKKDNKTCWWTSSSSSTPYRKTLLKPY